MSFRYSLIEKIDLFGSDIEFNIQKYKKSKTKIGGILTIICVLIILAAIWSLGSELIYKNQPIMDIENVLLDRRPFTTYTSKIFPISFCLQDYNQKTYNIEKYFKFEVSSIVTSTKNKSTIETILEYENCTYNHFLNYKKEDIDKAGVLDYLCLKNQSFTLGGYWDEDSINYLSIKIKICNNQTNNNTCAHIDEIYRWFRQRPIALNFYFGSNIINHINYDNPINKIIDILYKDIKLSTSKILNIYLRSQEIETNVGLVFNEKINLLSYTKDDYDYDESELIDGDIMTIKLFASNRHLTYRRRYMKLQDLLAQIGGLKNALFMISQILMFHYSRKKLNERIINKVYNFDSYDGKKDYVFDKICKSFEEFKLKNNLIDKKSKKYNDFQKKQFFDKESCQIIKSDSDLSNNKKSDNHSNLIIDKIDISISGYLKLLFCSKCLKDNSKLKKIYKLYDIAHNDILYSLDVRNIVKTIEEIKLLKFILFDFDQLVIFRYATNILGTIEERRNFSITLKDIRYLNIDENIMKSFISKFKMDRKDNHTEKEKRLLNFVS